LQPPNNKNLSENRPLLCQTALIMQFRANTDLGSGVHGGEWAALCHCYAKLCTIGRYRTWQQI